MACRICYESEDLVRVCACDGSLKWVHVKCIQQWVDVSHRSTCELCGQPFRHERLRKPIHIKRLTEWCILGMAIGCSETLMVWFMIMLLGPRTHSASIVHIAAIFMTVFSFLFFMTTVILWVDNKKAMPYILSYFIAYTVSNIALQCAAPHVELLPFYIASGGLRVFSCVVDHSMFTICPLQCNRLR